MVFLSFTIFKKKCHSEINVNQNFTFLYLFLSCVVKLCKILQSQLFHCNPILKLTYF